MPQMPLTADFAFPLAQSIEEITRRILQVIQPQRIVLFGSSARGEMTPHSDVDVLVILRTPAHRRQTAQAIYRNLHGISIPVDVVVATEQDLQRYGSQHGNVLRHALQEGRVIYDAG